VINRRTFLGVVAGGFLALPLAARGESVGRIARVGYLTGAARNTMPVSTSNFVDRLRELGYAEGRNLVIDYRFADTEVRLRQLASELIHASADVIYAQNPYALRAAAAATTTIPIVGYDYETDPVAAGFAASLPHPGGNVTGVFLDQPDISAKQLQLLKEMVPQVSRVAVLWDDPLAGSQRAAVEDAGRRLGVTILSVVWRGPDTLADSIRAAKQDGAQGLVVLSTPRILDQYRPLVADAALKNRLPAIGLTANFAAEGLLIAYGPVQRDMYRIAAGLVAKILDGARPADLPIERPVRFALAVNLKTAKALGLTIPHSVLLRTDEVIQ
jgi:putative tryptophan/tyrosine transport system substrate-binding protein